MKQKTYHFIWAAAIFSIFLSIMSLSVIQDIRAEETILPSQIPAESQTPGTNSAASTVTANTQEETLAPTNNSSTINETEQSSTTIDPSLGSALNQENMQPPFYFKLSSGQVVTGKTEIKGTVKLALSVEYYAVKDGTLAPKLFLGSASRVEDVYWVASYDFSQLPNDKFDIIAVVHNQYTDKYEAGRVMVIVKNPVVVSKEPVVEQDDDNDQSVKKLKTSEIKDKYKELDQAQKDIEKDSSLTVQQKQQKISQIETSKNNLKKEFVYRQEAERLFKKPPELMSQEEKEEWEKIKAQLKEDSDADGLPDFEEDRIGTDPFSADTDQDGYLDGDEVRKGFNPLKFSSGDQSDKIIYQEPTEGGEVNSFYEVNDVSYEKNEGADQATSSGNIKKVELKGKALPNSFITLYIYSTPIVVTLKTDEDGNWSYVLDKELENGEHKVYAAVTDNTGRITYKSNPLAFIKTAQAITKIEPTQSQLQTQLISSPIKRSQTELIKFVVVISTVSFLLALASISLFTRHHFKASKEKIKNFVVKI